MGRGRAESGEGFAVLAVWGRFNEVSGIVGGGEKVLSIDDFF